MNDHYVPIAQGYATPVEPDSIEDKRDALGFTNPNLHRRLNPTKPESELGPRDYKILVSGLNSYRTITKILHDEDSDTSEIP